MIKIKRIYEPPARDDGYRILVDRLWPRGMTKKRAQVDLWLKEIAPSDGLRKWFRHDLSKGREFKKRYFKELGKRGALIGLIKKQAGVSNVTLLYSAREDECNNALALREYLETK